jgi:hypothetical protein
MKIPKKFFGAAAKMFKSGGSSWSKKKQGIPFAALEQMRMEATSGDMVSRGRKIKLRTDKYGNRTSLRVNSDRIPSWRIGEKYAPGEHSKYDPTK